MSITIDKDGNFTIVRREGYGYVQNSVKYDELSINLLDKKYFPSELEGGSCEVHYFFKLIENVCSEIIFTENHDDDYIVRHLYYIDPNKRMVASDSGKCRLCLIN